MKIIMKFFKWLYLAFSFVITSLFLIGIRLLCRERNTNNPIKAWREHKRDGSFESEFRMKTGKLDRVGF